MTPTDDTSNDLRSPQQPARRVNWSRWLPRAQRRARRLRLVETLPLGERRFVAIVTVDGHELLIGSAPHSLQLLRELGPATPAETAAAPALKGPAAPGVH